MLYAGSYTTTSVLPLLLKDGDMVQGRKCTCTVLRHLSECNGTQVERRK